MNIFEIGLLSLLSNIHDMVYSDDRSYSPSTHYSLITDFTICHYMQFVHRYLSNILTEPISLDEPELRSHELEKVDFLLKLVVKTLLSIWHPILPFTTTEALLSTSNGNLEIPG